MKVLYLIDSLSGYGAEKSLVDITTRFTRVEPIFVHIYEGDQLKKVLENKGIRVYSLNLSGKYDFIKAEKLVLSIIEEEKPQIIHSTLFRADIIARRIKKRFPHIILVGSLVNNSYSSFRFKNMNLVGKLKHFIIKEWDRITSKYVDYFISNSEAIITPNVAALGIKKNKITTIYRGRNLQPYSKKKVKLDTDRFPIKSTNLVFLNVSRLEQRKGQKDLIKAFKIFLASRPGSILLLVGEGPQRKELENLILRLNLNNSIFILGYRNDVEDLLALSDFFVFPTYYEGLPGALIEAILSKTPVIVSNIPENNECFADGSSLLFQPGNINDMSQKMLQAISLENWDLKTERAYSYAKERFDVPLISKQYEHFYNRIC